MRVCAPENRETKPNLTFKAPTYANRVSSFLSPRQGGSYPPVLTGLFLMIFALTVKVFQEKKIITPVWFYNPVNYILFKTLQLGKNFNGVYSVRRKNLQKILSPPL